jgi:hypothetical protein
MASAPIKFWQQNISWTKPYRCADRIIYCEGRGLWDEPEAICNTTTTTYTTTTTSSQYCFLERIFYINTTFVYMKFD